MVVAPEIVVARAWVPEELDQRLRTYQPRTEFGRIVRDCLRFLPVEQAVELIEHVSRVVVIESSLRAVKICGDGRWGPDGALLCRHDDLGCQHRRENYGVVSRKVVTNAGVQFLVDSWQNLTEMENMKFHGIGTGTTAEAAGDTALVTELTTEYNPNSTRATGSLTEGASANILRSVGTNTLDSGTPAVTEHILITQAATGGGTGWDRSVFSAINLTGTNGDGLQTTYDCTVNSGG